ncbi:MAG: hypothetical protein JO356_16520 [Acidobacteria bacterium]|nr:hypothetical protein [Acidobacteriota bacterium]
MSSNSAPCVTHEERIFQYPAPPHQPRAISPGGRLEIWVLFTTPGGTIAALERAACLLKGLEGCISLVEVQTVPYPLPLNRPPVALNFTKQRLLAIAAQSELEIAVSVYLCRSAAETLARILKPGSIVVIGCRRQWWRNREEKLASKLRRAGYHTVVVKAPSART